MPDFFAGEDRAQRSTLALRDVDYGISARMHLTARTGEADNIRKFEEMFNRRLEKGQQHYQPYLGCREFTAFVEPWDGNGALATESRDLGWMLHDIRFGVREGGIVGNDSRFFPPTLRAGVIDVPAWENAVGEFDA
jgi:CRISPR-associated protein Cas5d